MNQFEYCVWAGFCACLCVCAPNSFRDLVLNVITQLLWIYGWAWNESASRQFDCVTHFTKWQHIFNLKHIWCDAVLGTGHTLISRSQYARHYRCLPVNVPVQHAPHPRHTHTFIACDRLELSLSLLDFRLDCDSIHSYCQIYEILIIIYAHTEHCLCLCHLFGPYFLIYLSKHEMGKSGVVYF